LTVKYQAEVGRYGILMAFGGGLSFQVGCEGGLKRLIPNDGGKLDFLPEVFMKDHFS
jgi:hypothetical protein